MATPRIAVRRLAAFVALTAILMSFVSSPAHAQDGERIAAVQIEQLRSANGTTVVPLRVTVVAQRALDAVLEVRVDSTNMSWEYPLALAANSEVAQLVAVPSAAGSLGTVDVSVFADGEEIAEDSINGREANENAVGLLGIEAPAAELQLTPDIGKASIIEVNDLRLLRALDTLIVSPAGLRGLSSEEQTQLFTWLATGHQLGIADEVGSVDELLPVEWRQAQSVVGADAGIIRYLGRDWAERVPVGITSASSASLLAGGFEVRSDELLSDAGFRVPSLGVLSLMLVAYLLIAGPVTFAVLTMRKRQTFAWVVIPALALLFTGGVFTAGRLLNSGRSDAYASIVEVTPAGGSVTETFLVSRSGRRSIELPEGYGIVGTGVPTNFGRAGGGAPLTITPSRTTTDLEFEIDAGSGGTAIVEGFDASASGLLSVTDLQIVRGRLSGSVRNASGERLENVTVLVGGRAVVVGQVDDDSSATFELRLDNNPARFAPELREWNVDPRDVNNFQVRNGANEELLTGSANGSSWLVWRATNYGAAVPEGVITAVGWSRDLETSVKGGRGRTAIVARAALPASDAPLVPAQVRALRASLPGGNPFNGFDGGFEGGFGSEMVTQFVPPAGGDVGELALDVRRNISEASVWIGNEWRSFALENDTGPSILIPAQAWEDGVLTVRYRLGEFFGEPGQFMTRLVPVTNGTDDVALLPAGERGRRQAQFDGIDEGFGGGDAVPGEERVVENPLNAEGNTETTFEFSAEGELAGTVDFWNIELRDGDEVDIRMNMLNGGFNGGLDPSLRLRAPDGNEVAFNDDFEGLNSRIERTIREDGVFTIETAPLSGAQGGGSYEVLITVTRDVEAG